MRKHFLCALLFVLAVLLISAPANSQVLSGTISGTVVDPTDARIPDAKVKVIDLGTGREYSVTSDSSGSFTVPNIANGFYRVEVEAAGFNKVTIERLQVFVSQTSTVVARMEVGRVGTEVVVAAEQTIVQTESVELKNSVDRAQIMQLPLPTRNPLDLVRTMAGIATPTTSGIADAFVHGLRGNSTNITQDGINVADNFVKTSSFFAISAPTVDTVGEFNVSVGGIGADAGFGAAQVSIVTARGTNDFHGSAFWYQRTNALNANTWFNNAAGHNTDGTARQPRPFQLQQRLGASAGGPVYIPKLYNGKNRTHVFGTYEAYREPLSRPRVRTLMTTDARRGLFTYTPTSGGGSRQINLLPLGTFGTATTTPIINQDAMNFYNSLVPADGFTDAGCTGDGVNIRCYPFNLGGKNIQDRYTLRVDHRLSDNHALEFIWNQADFDSTPDLLNGIEPQFPKSLGGGQGSRRQVFVWALQSVFSSSKTNEFRVGYTRAPVGFNLFNDYSSSNGYQLQFTGVTQPTYTSTNIPQGRNTPVRQIMDNFAWVKGSHNIRVGGEYRQVLANSYFYNIVVPLVSLGTNPSNPDGITADDFPGGINAGDLGRAQQIFRNVTGLLGSVQQGFNHTSPKSGFVPGVPRTIDPIQHNFAWYAQDTWRVKPGLTAQFGVRHEYQGVFDLRNQLVLLPTNGLAPNGDVLLDFAGGRNGKPIYNRDLNNFAPFAGLAWDPWKNGKTSIRSGFSTHFVQDGITLYQLASTGNTGLFSTPSNTTPTGGYRSAGNPGPATPVATFPVSQRANFIANNGVALWDFKRDLATPYVLEWNLAIQRELWNKISIEARYVGNHAVKQIRSFSINEIDLDRNGLLQEFQAAQRNLAVGGGSFANQGRAGQVNLPVMDRLFAGLPAASGYTNAQLVTWLNQNQAGALWDNLRRLNTYRVNRETLPADFFVPSPYAAGANLADTPGWSYYHGFEFEVRRRFSKGLFVQANYTYSKVMADTSFLTSQNEGQNYRSLKNTGLDKNRAAFDVPHSYSMNFLYPLPIGRGKSFWGNAPRAANVIVGGWNINGLTRWSAGAPFNITSNRQVTGSLFAETAMIRNMTATELQKHIGVYRHPTGVFWLNPDSGLVTISGNTARAVLCTPAQTTPCFDHPGANQFGNTPVNGFNTPRFFNQDFGITKSTRIREGIDFEIRFEFFNAFNNANFGGITSQIDNAAFGKLTNTVDTVRGGGVTSRIIQWAAKVNF